MSSRHTSSGHVATPTQLMGKEPVLRCPHCLLETAHKDRRGGLGYIVTSRYIRLITETGQLAIACPQCKREILPGQLVDDTDRGKGSSSSSDPAPQSG